MAQPVAGDLRSPPDDQWDDRDRRSAQAGGVGANGPTPTAGAVQLLQGRDGPLIAHVYMMALFAAVTQSRSLVARPGRCRYIQRLCPSSASSSPAVQSAPRRCPPATAGCMNLNSMAIACRLPSMAE